MCKNKSPIYIIGHLPTRGRCLATASLLRYLESIPVIIEFIKEDVLEVPPVPQLPILPIYNEETSRYLEVSPYIDTSGYKASQSYKGKRPIKHLQNVNKMKGRTR
jgi:hypothetical protein